MGWFPPFLAAFGTSVLDLPPGLAFPVVELVGLRPGSGFLALAPGLRFAASK